VPTPAESDSPFRSPQGDQEERARPSHAGRWTVAAMLLFGFGIVGALWLYWDQYTRPFRPLQTAILQKYPDCRAYVVGGRPKSHQEGTVSTLRVVLQLPLEQINPVENETACLNWAIDLFHLAREFQDLRPYQDFEVHLVQQIPEKPARQWTLHLPIRDWEDLKPIPAE